MRGEKEEPKSEPQTLVGSSPRAWGKAQPTARLGRPTRIIPTCVGKRLRLCSMSFSWSDHPHVRGEKRGPRRRRMFVPGSSPRAWGKAYPFDPSHHVLRIIPTCVGKSLLRLALRNRLIIPTCVGKRLTHKRFHVHFPDHPHVRGEKRISYLSMVSIHGSSPRAWGKVYRRYLRRRRLRIIPTCVGKRQRNATRSIHLIIPRAWGKGHGLLIRGGGVRIIPTCVGKR